MDKPDMSGTWLMINDGKYYGKPMVIKFEGNQILHYEILDQLKDGFLQKKLLYSEKWSETKNEVINENRIRFFRMGKTHTIISENKSKTEYTEFTIHYERLTPTLTELTEEEIQKLQFFIEWNNEILDFKFNQTLDSITIQELNKRLGKEGRKLVLEKIKDTYFGTLYDNGNRVILLAIKEIDHDKVVLYGFPKEPYQVVGYPK
ncbi:hypothetical protein [Allomuricauda sp. M10]|uniref:hypothetical protein n=1 Tax=Allomuricauda sp. M10 TaxID=2683292 RepID=UPI001D18FDAA|nr:hypothetical protein [Muricauda sp. M10]